MPRRDSITRHATAFSMERVVVLIAVGVMEKALYSSYTRAPRPKGEGIYFLSFTTSDWTSAGLPKMRSKKFVLMA